MQVSINDFYGKLVISEKAIGTSSRRIGRENMQDLSIGWLKFRLECPEVSIKHSMKKGKEWVGSGVSGSSWGRGVGTCTIKHDALAADALMRKKRAIRLFGLDSADRCVLRNKLEIPAADFFLWASKRISVEGVWQTQGNL